jgi:carbon storage regulator
MLVLTIRNGKSVLIGNDITVTLVETKKGQVRLGFTAPKELPIVRCDAKKKEVP